MKMNKITALLLLLLAMPFSVHSMETGGACALPLANDVTEVDATEGAAASVAQQDLTESQQQLIKETETEAEAKVKSLSQSQLNKRQVAYSKAASTDGVTRTQGYTNIAAKPTDPEFKNIIDVTPEETEGTGSTYRFKEGQKDAYLNEVNRKYIANSPNGGATDQLNSKTRSLISNYMDEGPTGDGTFSSNEGMPGFHAEVRATNNLFNLNEELLEEDAEVATYKLSGRKKLGSTIPFKACANCSGILKSPINIVTDPLAQ